MIWPLVIVAIGVALALLAAAAVMLILSDEDGASIFSDKHPIHAPAEPIGPPPRGPGAAYNPPAGGRIVNVPIEAIRDDRIGVVPFSSAKPTPPQIAQDRIAAPRREDAPPAVPPLADMASDEPGAVIIPFGEVGVYPDDGSNDIPPADVDCPCPIEQASPLCLPTGCEGSGPPPRLEIRPCGGSDFGGMGSGNTIRDVGGDW